MDQFVEFTSADSDDCDKKWVMGYYDGNTVTALWNYAQHFSISDNSFGTGFGPSTPGALNLIAGNTHGATPPELKAGAYVVAAQGTVIGDADPKYDDCSDPKYPTIAMSGRSIGDLLNAKGVTWGWFQGGFRRTGVKDGKAVCGAHSTNLVGIAVTDYSPHHEPFQYYRQTANPEHHPPSSVDMIGKTDLANHQYDLSDFFDALKTGNLPEVIFIKAKRYQDGHAGMNYSNPLDEQEHLVEVVNAVERSPFWNDVAIIIAYDDSDGWYDHVMAPAPIANPSSDEGNDALTGLGTCGAPKAGSYANRCGYGPRLPLLLISPYARPNFVDHTTTDQTSIVRFIEDNWDLGPIGDQSMDAIAGPLEGMFNFSGPRAEKLLLDGKSGLSFEPMTP